MIHIGDIAQPENNEHVQKRVREALGAHKRFPGPLPKGCRRFMLSYIRQSREEYMATLKLDGRRVLLFIDYHHTEIFIMDRTLSIYKIPQSQGVVLSGLVGDVILDGELIMDKDQNIPYFLAFDVLRYNGVDVRERPLTNRYSLLTEYTLLGIKVGMVNVYAKRFANKHQMRELLNSVHRDHSTGLYHAPISSLVSGQQRCSNVTFPVDGLILMCMACSYDDVSAHVAGMVKWKYAPSVDVMAMVVDIVDNNPMIDTFFWEYNVRNARHVQTFFKSCVPTTTTIHQPINGQRDMICVECIYDGGKWRILHTRPDKMHANSSRAIHDTVTIIHENISVNDVCNTFEYVPLTFHTPYNWIEDVWQVGGQDERYACEVEGRLIHKNQLPIRPESFYAVLSHLYSHKDKFDTYTTMSTDYTCNNYRVTVVDAIDNRPPLVIRKERHAAYDIDISPEWIVRCSLSYEHPVDGRTWNNDVIDELHTTIRRKHRVRFVDCNRCISIDCTAIHQTDHENGIQYKYEIEVELIRGTIDSNGAVGTIGAITSVCSDICGVMSKF
jgi:hypothetical protein